VPVPPQTRASDVGRTAPGRDALDRSSPLGYRAPVRAIRRFIVRPVLPASLQALADSMEYALMKK